MSYKYNTQCKLVVREDPRHQTWGHWDMQLEAPNLLVLADMGLGKSSKNCIRSTRNKKKSRGRKKRKKKRKPVYDYDLYLLHILTGSCGVRRRIRTRVGGGVVVLCFFASQSRHDNTHI